jgi:hypothetical protein
MKRRFWTRDLTVSDKIAGNGFKKGQRWKSNGKLKVNFVGFLSYPFNEDNGKMLF